MKRSAWLIFILCTCSSACQSSLTTSTSAQSTTYPVHGVALSPQNFPNDYSLLNQFYAEVASMPNGGVLYNGGWREDLADGSDAGEIPEAISAHLLASQAYGNTPLVVIGWRSDETIFLAMPGAPIADWGNQPAREAMLAMLVDLAESYQPPLLFLGNENDFYFQQNPEDYSRWIDFYDQAYLDIKAASPHTLVGPVFNFEHLAGTGRFTGWVEPQWEALESHDLARVDMFGLTLYPFLAEAEPGGLPADYLAPLLQRIGDTPLAITETGWPASPSAGVQAGWTASEEAQVEYLTWLDSALHGQELIAVTWLFLHPLSPPTGGSLDPATAVFASISLRDIAGLERPVYQAWIQFSP